MTDHITGPGILFERSRIPQEAQDFFDKETFLHWYDDHITEFVATPGMNSGFRYIDVNKSSPLGNESNSKPFLAIYPMADRASTTSEEFKDISKKSQVLPGDGMIYSHVDVDMDISVLGLGGQTERVGSANTGPANFILTCGVRTHSSASREAKAAFVKEVMTLVSEASGYSRTLTFELQFARTSAQTRALNGLLLETKRSPQPSRWLAIHEFETRPGENAVRGIKGDIERLEGQIGNVDGQVFVWELQMVHGERKMFD